MNQLPPGWEWTTIGEIGEYLNGRGFKKSEWSDHGRPIIRIQNLTGSGAAFNHYQGEADERHIVRSGDLLVSWAATLGVYVWRGPEAVLNQHIFKVESHIDAGFHRWLLEHALADLKRQTHGSGMVHITKGNFDATPVPLPPLAEQERIVTAIEEHLTRLEAAEAAVRSCSERLPAMSTAFTASVLDVDAPSRPIGTFARVGSGATPSRTTARYWSGGTIPWVSSGALNAPLVTEASAMITQEALAETAVKLWPPGTVLVAMYGEGKTRGRAAELGIESTCNQACAAIQVDPGEVRPRFLRWFLNSRYEHSRRLASGGVQPNLSLGLVRAIEVPVPSLAEQDRIIGELEERYEETARMADLLCRSTHRSEQLRRSLLTAAFSGRLVHQDLDDEPASVLLERIRAERAAAGPVKRSRKVKAS
jgi:type I restriction enzyme S subunit